MPGQDACHALPCHGVNEYVIRTAFNALNVTGNVLHSSLEHFGGQRDSERQAAKEVPAKRCHECGQLCRLVVQRKLPEARRRVQHREECGTLEFVHDVFEGPEHVSLSLLLGSASSGPRRCVLQMRTPPPFFITGTIGAHQSVGSVMRSMTPFSSMRWSSCSTFGSRGMVSSVQWKCCRLWHRPSDGS